MTRGSIRKAGNRRGDNDASFIVTPKTFVNSSYSQRKPEIAIVGGPLPYIAIHAEGHELISINGKNLMRKFAEAILETLK